QRDELGPRRAGREVAQRRVGLEHLVFRRADRAYLEEVIHDRDELKAPFVRGAGDGGKVRAEAARAVRRGEIGDLQANLHGVTSRSYPLMASGTARTEIGRASCRERV